MAFFFLLFIKSIINIESENYDKKKFTTIYFSLLNADGFLIGEGEYFF
jgi:hypothetical protein